MEYIKKCEVCGIEYKTTGTTSKYCSYECKMKNHYAKEREKNKLNPRNCIICGTEFNPETKFSVCCCKECKDIRQKQLTKEKDDRNREKKFEGKIEGIDYVVCAICGQKCTQISSGHFKMHGITSKEYLTKYPNSKLSCDSFCVKYKGENNPNSVKNTTEDQRKERSPFSNAFYKKRNIDISEKDKLIKDIHSDMLYNTQIEFYLNKGMSNEEAENALNERQKTFSLEKCIEKYGEK
ncbi:MAG: hypothetical protein RSE41_06875, partial [Clostridia bacterium]